MGAIAVIFFLAIALGLYFLPTIIAASKKRSNTGAIFALNLLLGWMLIGWVVALVWALTQAQNQQPIVQFYNQQGYGNGYPQPQQPQLYPGQQMPYNQPPMNPAYPSAQNFGAQPAPYVQPVANQWPTPNQYSAPAQPVYGATSESNVTCSNCGAINARNTASCFSCMALLPQQL